MKIDLLEQRPLMELDKKLPGSDRHDKREFHLSEDNLRTEVTGDQA
jgi:hypothetical protein